MRGWLRCRSEGTQVQRRSFSDGVQILLNLEHRGACGAEKNTGDGAGILIQIPHDFLVAACAEAKGHITLPAVGHYGVGMVFLPNDPGSRAACEHLFEKVVRDEGQRVLGWREVPVDSRMLGRPPAGRSRSSSSSSSRVTRRSPTT